MSPLQSCGQLKGEGVCWDGENPDLITNVCEKWKGWMKGPVKWAVVEHVFLIKVHVSTEVPFKFFFIE